MRTRTLLQSISLIVPTLALPLMVAAGDPAPPPPQAQPATPDAAPPQRLIFTTQGGSGRAPIVIDGPAGPFVTGPVGGPEMRQFAPRFSELLRPDFLRRDARVFAAELNLDSQQKSVVEVLLDDYLDSFDGAAKKLRDSMAQFQPPMPELAGQLVGDIQGQLAGLPRIAMEPGQNDDVMFFNDGNGMALMRVITAGEHGEIAPELNSIPIPASPDGTVNVTKQVTVNSTPGQEPQITIKMSAKDAQGNELIPSAAMDELLARVRERVAERLRRRMEQTPDGQAGPQVEGPKITPEELASTAREFASEKSRMREQFVTDMQSTLTPEQQPRWDHAQRTLRRQANQQRGRLGGEQLDLAAIAKRNAPQAVDTGAVLQALADYELQLDAAVMQRDALLQRNELESLEPSVKGDTDRKLEMAKQERDARLAVRAVNDATFASLSTLITDPAEAERFHSAALEIAHPRIYRPTLTQRSFREALAINDLTPEARQSITDLQRQYEAEMTAANERLVATARQTEPDQSIRMLEFMKSRQAGDGSAVSAPSNGPPPRPPGFAVAEGINTRSAIGRRYLAQLGPLLSPEQLEKVPSYKSVRQFDGAFTTTAAAPAGAPTAPTGSKAN